MRIRCCQYSASLRALNATVLLCSMAACGPAARAQAPFAFNTESVWTTQGGIIGSYGPGFTSTAGETIIAPDAAAVTLNDFTFYAQSRPRGTTASLDFEAFVYAWSGNAAGTGGGAVGSPLYLSTPFTYSPPSPTGSAWDGPWTPLTVSLGAGVSLNPGQSYVIGVTISNPTCYNASSGAIEFQEVPIYQIPVGTQTGGGEVVWDNNGNNFNALNNGAWSQGNGGVMAFTADFTVVPEPSSGILALAGLLALIFKRPVKFRAKNAKFAK